MPDRRGNPVDVKRLLDSKWTAVTPVDREKHFLVTKVHVDAEGRPETVDLEAVLTRRIRTIPWRALKDADAWRIGWTD